MRAVIATLFTVWAGWAMAACARDEAAPVCPSVAAGELVITEIHGEIHGDPGTAWVELYNAAGRALDLEGTRVTFEKLDGSAEIDTLIRRPLAAAPGAYTVLGDVDDDARPSFVDYGFAADWHGAGWLDGAALDVEACGARIDRVVYSSLPTTGSYSLGTMPPTAAANDLPASWCTDPSPTGTPQQANHACP